VYQFQNTFDYTRWTEDTKVKLVNVIWNSDYSDVVKFDTDAARDNYFDNIEDFYALELMQAARIVPQNFIKLPIPYDVMARYNYLFIDMPIATSADEPIDYETGYGIRRWYFFIDDITYQSPNTTQVFLSLDVWTNFQNDIEINYMMLERGHAPVYASDTESYLQNPVANNRYLLAPDVNFDNASITRSSDYVPFGNGEKYVCIASTCAQEQIASLGTVTTDPSYDPTGTITYSDINTRYGHQLQVNGLTIGNGRNYGNARTLAKAGTSNGDIIGNNLSVYALRARECYGNGTFFADVMRECPQFLNTVQACFVVDENCITLSGNYTIAGHMLYKCVGTKRNLLTKQLQKSDFKYPTEFERFAKLYTSPYAVLEVTDNDGTTFTINIEETSTVQVKSVVSVAFPYIDYRVYLDGIGGTGSKSYSWVDLSGQSHDRAISDSDWFKYCFDWEIPTFALYMDGETAFQLSNFNRNMRMGINNALVAYHNAMRSANTANANATDSADTALSNVNNSTETARTNSYNSADTGKTNADNSADTGKANADASADTTYTNLDNNCTTLRTNLNLAIANTVANEEAGISASTAQTGISNNLAVQLTNLSNTACVITSQTERETTTATTTNSGIGNIASGAVGGIMGGAGLGAGAGAAIGSVIPGAGTAVGAGVGALGGAIIGGIGGAIAAVTANGNAAIVTQANEITSEVTQNTNAGNTNATTNAASSTLTSTNIQRRLVYTNNNNLADAQMTNNNATDRTNGNNAKVTTKANATRTQNTAKANATNTQSTAKTNANNNYNTDRTNATNTRNVTVANSGYTRDVEELNAKENLENAANAAMAAVNDARNNKPTPIGKTNGNPTTDYMENRGVQIKVKTQSDSAIRQTGDTFARYGYALNQVWDVKNSGLKLMQHFTYWKASDIWVDDRQSSNNIVQEFITKMFLQGVTVWNNPNEIGRVRIYDN
jgi:hypothetical protein